MKTFKKIIWVTKRLLPGLLVVVAILGSFPTDLLSSTQIRQEINILDAAFSGPSGSQATSSEIVLLDSTQYSSGTYYFEVDASTTSATNATISLVNATSGVSIADLTTVNGTSFARYRSSSFTPPGVPTEYKVQAGNQAVGKKVIAARIVILQNATSLTNTETDIEIGNNEILTSTATSTLASPKYWSYNSSKWDGSPTFAAEVTYQVLAGVASSTAYNSSGTFTVTLPKSAASTSIQLIGGGGAGGGGTVSGGGAGGAGGQFAQSTTTAKGITHTLVVAAVQAGTTGAGANGNDSTWDTSVVVAKGGTGGGAVTGGTVASSTGNTTGCVGDLCRAGGSGGAGTAAIGGVGGGGAGTNGAGSSATSTSTTLATAQGGSAGGAKQTSNGVGFDGTTPGGGAGGGAFRTNSTKAGGQGAAGRATTTSIMASTTIALQEDNGAFASWTDKVYMVTTSTQAAGTSTRYRTSFTPVNGKHYRIAYKVHDARDVIAIYNAKIIVDQTSPTLLEPQYLLSSTKLVAGTGLQGYLTSWLSTEWNTVNTYLHQMDAADNSTSVAGVYTSGGVLVTGSTVTSPDNSATSSSMTMPSDGDLDVKATTNNNDIYANRILVDAIVRPDDPTSATVTAGDTLNTLAWTNATANASSTIVLRRASSAVTDTPTDSTNYATSTTIGSSVVVCVGLQTSCTDSGLSNGTAYHYKMFTWSTNGYYSAGVVPTGSPATPNTSSYTEQAYKFYNATSTDGLSWTSRTSPADNTWAAVTYGNGTFVAIAQTGSGNRVMTSSDGVNWATSSGVPNSTWVSVTYGNGTFVAVGSSGAVMTASSSNPASWTARTAAAANNWNSVTYGNGLFVAVSSTGTANRVMTSTDGINWTSQNTTGNDQFWISVTYGDGQFVAVGGNAVMTSTNGTSWTAQTPGSSLTYNMVAYGNGTFVAVANGGTVETASSSNVTSWTPRTGAGGNDWSAVAYGNGLFVAVACGISSTCNTTSGNRVMTSPDGISWTLQASAVDTIQWEGLAYGNGMFVSVSDSGSGNRIMTSGQFGPHPGMELAATSTAATLTYAGQAFRLRLINRVDTANLNANSGKSFKLQYATKSGTCDTSFTGETYADITSSTTIAYYDNPDFDNATTTTATSSDPIDSGRTVRYETYHENNNFTNPTAIASGEDGLWDFSLIDNGATAGTSYCIRAVKSTDAQTWNPRSAAGNDDTWSQVIYGNGLFVAVGTGGPDRVMTSPDGLTWTPRSPAEPNSWDSVAYGNGLFVAVSYDGTDRVMTSPDGTTWSPVSAAGNDDGWLSVTYGNGLFVAVGYAGTDRVMTSPDGTNWTPRSAAGNNDSWSQVIYGNGLFVAVGSGPDYVMTSPDGTNWTPRSAAGDNDAWVGLTYGNGLFVAVGNTGDRVMTSPDGITWTARSAAGNDDTWYSVTYGNGLFVAVASLIDRVMTSPDGITWTARSAAGNDDTWIGVTYGTSTFVAVGQGPDVAMTASTSATVLDTYTVVPEVATAGGAVNVTQLHYRWRNDDGTETGATFAAAEDTALTTGAYVGDRKRVRFVLSDTSGSATSYTYQLEQASSSCTAWISVPSTNTAGTHWVGDISQYFLDGGATTNSASLTDPGGSSFVNGYMKAGNTITPALSLTSAQFTENEYTIRSTSAVSVGTTYCFRVTNAGDATKFTYTQTPQISVLPNVQRPVGGGGGGEGNGSGSTIGGGNQGGGGGNGGGEGNGSGGSQGGGNKGGGGGGDTGFLFRKNFFAIFLQLPIDFKVDPLFSVKIRK